MAEYQFDLFADYYQFYLQDEQAAGDLSNSWTEQAIKDRLALAPGTIGIGTARNTTVPVMVVIHSSAPDEENPARWSHINECSLDLPSGRIVVAGCTDYFPDASRIDVKPGQYRARIYYGGLDTISEDGLAGSDNYKIVLWPDSQIEYQVLKRY